MRISGSSVLVTGGASGLGAATVRRFAAAGARVTIADLDHELGQELARDVGSEAEFLKADVTDGDGMRVVVRQTAERQKGLHITVNCAGIAPAKKVLGREGPHDLESFARVVRVNLIGTFNVLRLSAEAMQGSKPNDEGERGVIVNTASVAAFEGQIGQAAYAASKAGVAGLTLPAARELARHGIRVVAIAPGLFHTPMFDGLPEAARESLGKQPPFPNRLGRPDEFAALAEHIVVNPMLNGETIRLDGAVRMAAK